MSACPRRSLSEAGSRCMLTTNGQTWVRYKKKNEEKTKRERERNGVYVCIHIYIKYLSPSNQHDGSATQFSFSERENKKRKRERENHLGDRRRSNDVSRSAISCFVVSRCRASVCCFTSSSWISWEVGDENLIRLDFRYRETLIDRVVVSLFLSFFFLFLKISVKLKMDSMGWFEKYSSFRVTFRKFIFSLLLRISTNFFIIS